jgi:hypothetical protein
MAEQVTHIATHGGVESADQAPGFIEVIEEEGSTVFRLFTDDGAGNATSVWLDWTTVAQLMVALGAAGSKL